MTADDPTKLLREWAWLVPIDHESIKDDDDRAAVRLVLLGLAHQADLTGTSTATFDDLLGWAGRDASKVRYGLDVLADVGLIVPRGEGAWRIEGAL